MIVAKGKFTHTHTNSLQAPLLQTYAKLYPPIPYVRVYAALLLLKTT